MRTCVASGNTSGALAVYKQLWTVLAKRNTTSNRRRRRQELVVAIRRGTYRPAIPGLEARKAATVANIEDVDLVILLAVKLAIAWATKSGNQVRNSTRPLSCAWGELRHVGGSQPRGAAISCSTSGRLRPSWRSRQTTNSPAPATIAAPSATNAAGTSPKNR